MTEEALALCSLLCGREITRLSDMTPVEIEATINTLVRGRNTRAAIVPSVRGDSGKQGWMVREGTHQRVSGHLSEGPKYRSCLFKGGI